MLKIFIAIDGSGSIEELRPRFHLVDEVDGHHLMSKDCIYRHDEHTRPALMLSWGGNGLPLSHKVAPSALGQDLEDSDFYKAHHARIAISGKWPRMFAWAFRWVMRWFYFLFACFCLGLGLYILTVLVKVLL